MLGEMILLGFSQGSPAVIVEAVSSKSAITMEELVKLDRFSSSNQVAAFYGQSLALVVILFSPWVWGLFLSCDIHMKPCGWEGIKRIWREFGWNLPALHEFPRSFQSHTLGITGVWCLLDLRSVEFRSLLGANQCPNQTTTKRKGTQS